MITIDLDKAQALVAECIAERGEDYVYTKDEGTHSCQYVHGVSDVWNEDTEEYEQVSFDDATPGCLVGMALHKAGIPLESLGSRERNEDGSFDLISKLESDGLVWVSMEAQNYLGNAQCSQDLGVPWKRAAEAAARGKSLEHTYDGTGRKTGEFVERDNYAVA